MGGDRRFLTPELPDPPAPNREGAVALHNGRSIGWAEFGDPGGSVVLWFHGTPGGRRQVPPDIDAVARQRGLRVVTLERPGSGLSTPWLHSKVADWADDVEQAADALGIDTFSVVGLSGGGPYVLACLALLPHRATSGALLGGIGPTHGDERCGGYTQLLRPFEPVLKVLRGPLAETLTIAVKPIRPYAVPGIEVYARFLSRRAEREALLQPAMKAMFVSDLCATAEGGLRAPVLDLVLFARPWGFSVAGIEQPVSFWHGDADGIVPLNHSVEMAARLPHAHLEVIPGGGHFAGFLRPADVLDRLTHGAAESARPTSRRHLRST